MIDPELKELSVLKQCELLLVPRSTFYYQPQESESAENLELMELIDRIWLASPAFGSRKIVQMLTRQGHVVNRKRVRRLMKVMGIESLAPRPKTTRVNQAHHKYPYLLRALDITRANQVWCADITYIPYAKGFMYLVAVMDWHSRKVLSWRISNTMGVEFCVSALNEALAIYGTPEIFNTDQGAQFTSMEFTSVLNEAGVAISMDGKGRVTDNIFIERLWRTLKYEYIYISPPASGTDLKEGLSQYIMFYNSERPHNGIGESTPDEAYYQLQLPTPQVA